MFENCNENQLKIKILKFVKTKIKNVKSVEDINVRNFCEVLSPIDLLASYDRLSLLKKILQIIINIYNHYDIYKDLQVKFPEGNQNDLTPLYYYFKYSSKDHSWKCKGPPTESHVVEAVYNYVICFISLEIKEIDHNEFTENDTKFDKCYFCEYNIRDGEASCAACNSSIKEMNLCSMRRGTDLKLKGKRKKNLSPEKTMDISNALLNNLNDDKIVDNETKDDIPPSGKIAKEVEVNDKGGYDVEWRCSRCESMFNMKEQPDQLDVRALYNQGKVICERCVSDIIYNTDEVSNSSNTGYREEVRQGCRGEARQGYTEARRESKWRCGSCGLLNHYDRKSCDACEKSLLENGRWICTQCSFENKFIYSECEVCLHKNYNLVVKFCQLCKLIQINKDDLFCKSCINESKMVNSPWDCKYIKCGCYNDKDDKFCNHCGLWRNTDFGSLKCGHPVRRLKRGKEEAIWICNKCYTFTSVSANKCNNWSCWSTRFMKKQCQNCLNLSDGKSEYCKTCKMIIE